MGESSSSINESWKTTTIPVMLTAKATKQGQDGIWVEENTTVDQRHNQVCHDQINTFGISIITWDDQSSYKMTRPCTLVFVQVIIAKHISQNAMTLKPARSLRYHCRRHCASQFCPELPLPWRSSPHLFYHSPWREYVSIGSLVSTFQLTNS